MNLIRFIKSLEKEFIEEEFWGRNSSHGKRNRIPKAVEFIEEELMMGKTCTFMMEKRMMVSDEIYNYGLINVFYVTGNKIYYDRVDISGWVNECPNRLEEVCSNERIM